MSAPGLGEALAADPFGFAALGLAALGAGVGLGRAGPGLGLAVGLGAPLAGAAMGASLGPVPGLTGLVAAGALGLGAALALHRPAVPFAAFALALAGAWVGTALSAFGILALGGAVGVGLGRWSRDGGRARRGLGAGLVLAAALVLGGGLVPAPRPTGGVTARDLGAPDVAAEVTAALLTRVYAALALTDETAIYDALAEVATDPVVAELYLARARVLVDPATAETLVAIDAVEVARAVPEARPGGWRVDAGWTVRGTISHLGHRHGRANRYDATLDLVARDGAWVIGAIALRDQVRIDDPGTGHLE